MDRNPKPVLEGMMLGFYFSLVVLATPLALLEAALGAGGTLTVQTCRAKAQSCRAAGPELNDGAF